MQYLQSCERISCAMISDTGLRDAVWLASDQLQPGRREDRSGWTELGTADPGRSVERTLAGIEGRQPRPLRCIRLSFRFLPGQRTCRGDAGNAAIRRGASSIRCGKSEGQGAWREDTQVKDLARRSCEDERPDDEGSVVHILHRDRLCRSAARDARAALDGNQLTD